MEISNIRRSWNALKASPNWFRTVVLLGLVQLIPIFGQIAAFGFMYRWAREAAWGIEASLPNKVGDTNGLLKTGAIVFVTLFCWNLIITLISSGLSQIPAIGPSLSFLCSIAAIFAAVFLQVMCMRAVVYDSFQPAIQVGQAWDMTKRDPKGLVPVLVISLIMGVVVAIIAIAVGVIVMMGIMFPAAALGAAGDSIGSLAIMLVPLFIITVIVVVAIILLVSTVANILIARTVGYWVAQFKPGSWGPSADYLPTGSGPMPR